MKKSVGLLQNLGFGDDGFDNFNSSDSSSNPSDKFSGRNPKRKTTRLSIEQTLEDANAENEESQPVTFESSYRPTTRCWGCLYGNIDKDMTEKPKQYNLWKMFRDTYGTISDEALALNMHEYFTTVIRKPALKDNQECEDWPKEMIMEHFQHHCMEPKVEIVNQIRKAKHTRSILENVMLRKDKQGNYEADLKVIDSILKLNKHINQAYGMKPTAMIGFNKTLDMK